MSSAAAPRVRVLFCDLCGAPLDAPTWDAVVRCRYCRATNLVGSPDTSVMPDDGRPRVSVGGRTYVVEGLIAHGDACDVFRARWAMRLGELVVLKITRALCDEDLLRREWRFIEGLCTVVAQGREALAARLPQPIALGVHRSEGTERPVAVYRWQSGFVHTLDDVRRVHEGGVDGRVAVWVWKRLLELLGFVHRAQVVHGAVIPAHVLVHPRDHGATLVGWGSATSLGERLPARVRAARAYYPEAARDRGEVSFATDLVMSARCVLFLAGGDVEKGRTPDSLPRPVADLVASVAGGATGTDAWALLRRLDAASREAYGPPSYNPLPMPGWS